VLISRISPADLQLAEEEALRGVVPPKHGQFQCRLCAEIFNDLALFKDHTTFHTGEYSYSCDACKYRFPFEDYIKTHWKDHIVKHGPDPKMLEINVFPKPDELNDLPGYVCPVCNWLQLNKAHVEHHVTETHGADCLRSTKIKKINMVMHLPFEEEEIEDISVKRGRKKKIVNYKEQG